MSEHANGDAAPKSLANAFAIMRREVWQIRRRVRRGKIIMPDGVAMVKLGRQFCVACAKIWDFAMLPEGSLPEKSVCSDCKKKLAEGYCIFTCGTETPIMVQPKEFKEQWPVGKIMRVSKEDYDKLFQKFKEKDSDVPGQKSD